MVSRSREKIHRYRQIIGSCSHWRCKRYKRYKDIVVNGTDSVMKVENTGRAVSMSVVVAVAAVVRVQRGVQPTTSFL